MLGKKIKFNCLKAKAQKWVKIHVLNTFLHKPHKTNSNF